MKKNLSLIFMVMVLFFFSCTTTNQSKREESNIVTNANNIEITPEKTQILDWKGRDFGVTYPPKWFKSMIAGNGNLYCEMNGLEESKNRIFITPQGGVNRSLDNALISSRLELIANVGQEMALSINSTMGSRLKDGQKDLIRNICARSQVDITGLRAEGDFWYLKKITDEYGNMRKEYNAYTFYSFSRNTYNNLLNIYLTEILKNKDIDIETVDEIANAAQEILNDAQKRDEKIMRKREMEQERLLAEYDMQKAISNDKTKQVIEGEKTKQIQSHNQAVADSIKSQSNANVSSQAMISPALADAIRLRKKK